MKFSELEDGENRLQLFKRELKTDLELERIERSSKKLAKWGDLMPWIVAAGMGWVFFFASLITHK